jgi:ribosome-associated protein
MGLKIRKSAYLLSAGVGQCGYVPGLRDFCDITSLIVMTTQRKLTAALLAHELEFSTARSGGPGGQNVNKVNTKVILKFDVAQSQLLTDEEREIITQKLSASMTNDGVLMVVAQETRSQLTNKEAAVKKLEQMLAKAFVKKKARKATKPSKGAVQDRIKSKKQRSEKKKWRQNPTD